jgi:hypothetical protein
VVGGTATWPVPVSRSTWAAAGCRFRAERSLRSCRRTAKFCPSSVMCRVPTRHFLTIPWNAKDLAFAPDHAHFIRWNNKENPEILTTKDLEMMVQSGAHFARKFDDQVDAAVLQSHQRRWAGGARYTRSEGRYAPAAPHLFGRSCEPSRNSGARCRALGLIDSSASRR